MLTLAREFVGVLGLVLGQMTASPLQPFSLFLFWVFFLYNRKVLLLGFFILHLFPFWESGFQGIKRVGNITFNQKD